MIYNFEYSLEYVSIFFGYIHENVLWMGSSFDNILAELMGPVTYRSRVIPIRGCRKYVGSY